MPLLSLYIISNIVIIGGYGFVAYSIMPKDGTVTNIRKSLFGALFFVTCALTHLELLLHVMADVPLSRAEVIRIDHQLIHMVQAVAVVGFAMEFVRRTQAVV